MRYGGSPLRVEAFWSWLASVSDWQIWLRLLPPQCQISANQLLLVNQCQPVISPTVIAFSPPSNILTRQEIPGIYTALFSALDLLYMTPSVAISVRVLLLNDWDTDTYLRYSNMCQRNDFIAMLCDLCLGMNWITGINSDHRYGLNVNK